MEHLTTLSYNSFPISFDVTKTRVMVNATEMAAYFDKQPVHWLNLGHAKDFLNKLAKLRNRSLADLVQVTRGGNSPGTWMHRDVAIEFARWLSPEFGIWCNDRIMELMQHGATALVPENLLNPDYIISVMTALKEERAEKARLMDVTIEQQKVIEKQAPKVEYCDTVLQSHGLMSTTQIAADMGLSAMRLNEILFKELGWQHKSNGVWVPSFKIKSLDYMRSKTYTVTNERGEQVAHQHFYWTQKGRFAIAEQLRKIELKKKHQNQEPW